ncbi:hypothetical protein CA54_44040 [Symmachiella macrocystis]|uniref:Uncharacterized protein n=1 Tax=Symmachiella macrocystis TaxID=2527985 RepID=A0A5C6BFB1_9PLAN|nr:hypothetical protein CA54_44040 [Symmachiella macrocystis]
MEVWPRLEVLAPNRQIGSIGLPTITVALCLFFLLS